MSVIVSRYFGKCLQTSVKLSNVTLHKIRSAFLVYSSPPPPPPDIYKRSVATRNYRRRKTRGREKNEEGKINSKLKLPVPQMERRE
jgi:hypothetical protein